MAPDAVGNSVHERAQRARAASLILQSTSTEVRSHAVRAVADALWAARREILAANAEDVQRAQDEKLEAPLLDRLYLSETKLSQVLEGVRQIADMADPLGQTVRSTQLDDGLDLYQVTVPIGVIGVVFESRPDALVQIAALTVKSGNAALLKGGREAERTNAILVGTIRTALLGAGIPSDAVVALLGRNEVSELLAEDELVDLIIPRGSSAFVRHIIDHTRIPVMGHAEGICHVYIDADADLDHAVAICMDAKTDYPAACNAVETILVHQDVAESLLPRLRGAAKAAGVTLVEDGTGFGREYGTLTCAVGIVDTLDAAIAHIHRYGSGHSDAIVTENRTAAQRFVANVDAASVLVNASTRFADGFRYGLGAEVGISTGKLHARGPVGLDGLTSTKWVVLGHGQTAGAYQGDQARAFLHRSRQRSLEDGWE